MAIMDRIFPLIIMGLILVFSLIHLGVSIGIIAQYRKFGDIFQPQIGLAGYNLAISFFGLIAGISGIFVILTSSPRIGKIVCGISAAVGVMALASLVAAIIINAKSIGYVSTRFKSSMNAYASSSDARNRVDKFQTDNKCCGVYTWLDWANVKLVAPNVTTSNSTTPIMMSTTTTTTMMMMTTTTTAAGTGKNLKRDVNAIFHDSHQQESISSANNFRRKRQTVASYGDISGLPLSYGVTFPDSCCADDATIIETDSIGYCVSNQNNVVNHFYTDGCLNPLDTIAGNQAMGFGVINSFLVVLAFIAFPVLWQKSSSASV